MFINFGLWVQQFYVFTVVRLSATIRRHLDTETRERTEKQQLSDSHRRNQLRAESMQKCVAFSDGVTDVRLVELIKCVRTVVVQVDWPTHSTPLSNLHHFWSFVSYV